jgi:hypothetical protein
MFRLPFIGESVIGDLTRNLQIKGRRCHTLLGPGTKPDAEQKGTVPEKSYKVIQKPLMNYPPNNTMASGSFVTARNRFSIETDYLCRKYSSNLPRDELRNSIDALVGAIPNSAKTPMTMPAIPASSSVVIP